MIPSEDLFNLIKSLSMSEKRHFKIFASRHVIGAQNSYVKLFNAIEKQSASGGEYNEQGIKAIFRNEKFIRYLPMHKKYLYKLVLKSLSAIYTEQTSNMYLTELLKFAEILCLKGQFAQAIKILDKANETASQRESHLFLLLISSLKKYAVAGSGYSLPGSLNEKAVLEEELAAIDNYKMMCHLWNVKIKADKLLEKGAIQIDVKKYRSIVGDPILNSRMDSKRAIMISRQILSACHCALGNYVKGYEYLKERIDVMEQVKEWTYSNPLVYPRDLNNLIFLAVQLGKYDEAGVGINKIKTFPALLKKTHPETIDAYVFQSAYSNEIELAIKTVKLHLLPGIIHKITAGLKKFKKYISPLYEQVFPHYIAYSYFLIGDFRQSLRWIHGLMNAKNVARESLQISSGIMNLAIHYELGNREIIKNTVRAIIKRMDNMGQQNEVLYLIADFFMQLYGSETKKEVADCFVEVKRKMLKYKPDELKIVTEYFDFISWVESKIQNLSFADLVREKVK